MVFLDGPWNGIEEVEAATADWVHWFNTDRLRGQLDHRAPTEIETDHLARQRPPQAATAA